MEALLQSRDCWDYARACFLLRSPFEACSPALLGDLRDAVPFTVRRGVSISSWRLHQLRELREIAALLRPMSDRVKSLRPWFVTWACGDGAHPAFVAAMCVSLGWPDESLACDMYLRGLSIVGVAPNTGL